MPKRRTDAALKRVRKTAKAPAVASVGNSDTAPATEPRANGATVAKPAFLDGRAAEIWDEFAPELIELGMLTHRDTLAFALWCQLGAQIEAGSLSAALVTQFRLLGNDFGCTPSGKGRELGAKPPAAKPSKFFKD